MLSLITPQEQHFQAFAGFADEFFLLYSIFCFTVCHVLGFRSWRHETKALNAVHRLPSLRLTFLLKFDGARLNLKSKRFVLEVCQSRHSIK